MADGTFGMSEALARETAPVWAKVKDHVTPMEWPAQGALISEINALKKSFFFCAVCHKRLQVLLWTICSVKV